jgi:hypothetical protein
MVWDRGHLKRYLMTHGGTVGTHNHTQPLTSPLLSTSLNISSTFLCVTLWQSRGQGIDASLFSRALIAGAKQSALAFVVAHPASGLEDGTPRSNDKKPKKRKSEVTPKEAPTLPIQRNGFPDAHAVLRAAWQSIVDHPTPCPGL